MYNRFLPARHTFFPDFFEDAFDDFFPAPPPHDRPRMMPLRTDIREVEGGYALDLEMPGVNKEDVTIKLNGKILTVAADVHTEPADEKQRFLRRERFGGHMERSFNVEGIDQNNIRAEYKNGVLTLSLPKLAALKPEEKTIAITDGE